MNNESLYSNVEPKSRFGHFYFNLHVQPFPPVANKIAKTVSIEPITAPEKNAPHQILFISNPLDSEIYEFHAILGLVLIYQRFLETSVSLSYWPSPVEPFGMRRISSE